MNKILKLSKEQTEMLELGMMRRLAQIADKDLRWSLFLHRKRLAGTDISTLPQIRKILAV